MMKSIQEAPSWPQAQAAQEAHASAVAQYGVQSPQAQEAAKERVALTLKCAREVGHKVPQHLL